MNQFAGSFNISEAEPGFHEQEKLNKQSDSLIDLDGNEIKSDGAGLFGVNKIDQDTANKFKQEEKQEKHKENPEDILSMLDNNSKEDVYVGELVSDRPELRENQSDTNIESVNINDELVGVEKEEVSLANGEVVENNKNFPYIKRLFESDQITEKSFKDILENLGNNQDISFIDDLDIDNQDKTNLQETFSSIENKDKNISNFSEKISVIEEFFNGYDLKLNEEGRFNTPVLNLIGENYIDLSNNEGNENVEIQKDLSTAIEATKNNILFEVKNIPTSSQTYIKAIENINSKELSKQIDGINSLYYLAYGNEGRYGAKNTLKLFKDKKQTKLLEEAKYLDGKINSMELSLKEAQKMLDRKKEIVLEMSELTGVKDGTKVEGGSIFQEAGYIDKISEENPVLKEQA